MSENIEYRTENVEFRRAFLTSAVRYFMFDIRYSTSDLGNSLILALMGDGPVVHAISKSARIHIGWRSSAVIARRFNLHSGTLIPRNNAKTAAPGAFSFVSPTEADHTNM